MSSGAVITRIAHEHAQLQLCIANCDPAVEELRNTNDLLESLERVVIEQEQQLEKLIEKRKSDHEGIDELHRSIDNINRSSTRRLLARMKSGGKEGLERKLEMEELLYTRTTQAERDEALSISALKAVAETARQKKTDLESQVEIRNEMLQYLDKLYEDAFDGPSPDFPEEDAAEQKLREAEVYFEHAQAGLNGEKTVYEILDRASECAGQAVSLLEVDVMEDLDSEMWSAHLVLAKELTQQAQQLLDRARGLQPSVRAISWSWIPIQPAFGTRATFVNVNKLNQGLKESLQNYQEVAAECKASKKRIKSLTRAAYDAQKYVMSQRDLLYATRRSILERIHEESGVWKSRDSDESTARPSQAMPHHVGADEVPVSVLAQDVPTVPHQDIPTMPREEDPPSYDSQSTYSFPCPEIGRE